MSTLHLGEGNQLGEFNAQNVASIINHINAQLGDVLKYLETDIAGHDKRIAELETWQSRYTAEKQSLTSLLINARTEARTVSDVHKLLREQIDAERVERAHRRRHLDNVLVAVFVVASANMVIDLVRVIRHRGRVAQP